MSGWIGVQEQASMIIICNVFDLFYMFAVGLSDAGCTLIGNAIGSKRIKEGKLVFRVISVIAAVLIGVATLVMYFTRRQMPRLYTQEESVVELTSNVMVLVSMIYFFDAF